MTPLFFLAAQILWGPYLQDVRQDRATVQWSTQTPVNGAVRLFTAAGAIDVNASATRLSNGAYLHKAPLLNLDPGTTYQYEIRLNNQPTATDPFQRLTTAGSVPFRFLVIGDTGDGGTDQFFTARALDREPAAFLLHAGDIAYYEGTFAQYESTFFRVYPALLRHVPFFPTRGNHDATNGGEAYRALFATGGLYYGFDWSNVHFTVLDSNQLNNPASPMLAWAEQDLADTRKLWRIVIFHHPPFPVTDYKRDDPICLLARSQITPILERQGVHLVLSGHEHAYHRTKPRWNGQWQPQGPGTVYVTTGGGGSEHYDPTNELWTAASSAAAHFLRITAAEASLTVEALTPAGDILDSWQITPGPAVIPNGIVDSAAFSPQLAPGGLASILGWNLNGAAIAGWPVLYTGRTQINAQVPFETAPQSSVTITTPQGAVTRPIALQPVSPNIFSTGGQSAAATHQDGALVTAANPAQSNEWISLYATGLGAVRPPVKTGAPAPSSPLAETSAPIQATLANRPAEVAIACLAPGFVGLYQINFRVPAGTPSGPQPLQLTAAGRPGNTVLLPIR